MVLADQDLGGGCVERDGVADVLRPDARIARHGAAQRDEIVQQRTGVLGHVEHAELGIEHVHLGRRLGLGCQLEDDPHTVDRVLLDRLRDAFGRRDQAGRAARDALAQAGIDLAARAARQHGAELELGAAAHRQAGQHVLAGNRFHEARGRDDGDLARFDIGFVEDAAHAAIVVDMAVRVDDGHHRLLRSMRIIVRERGARDFGGGERIDQDQAAVALDHRHVGDVEAAQLVEPLGDLEQAVGEVETGHAPQAGIDRGRRERAVDEGVFAQIPQHRPVGRAHHAVGNRRDQPALGGLEVGDLAERQRGRHRRIGQPGRGLGIARDIEVRRRNRNG